MNSGLQCLSNTYELTKYFCFNLHKKDMNRDNPLGMKGKLADHYAALIHEMWISGTGRLAPWDVKKTIGQRVVKFSGYGQQDSCELVNYLLDILHEDLNRVRKKPYVELKDSDGRPDEEVSKEHWEGFLMRNQSIVVDLMYGQLKSTVICQDCNRNSITFDPFLTLSLPIPRQVKLRLFVVPDTFFKASGDKNPSFVLDLTLKKDSNISDLRTQVSSILKAEEHQIVIANQWRGDIQSIFHETQSCQDIDQAREDTIVYFFPELTKSQKESSLLFEFRFYREEKRGGRIANLEQLEKALARFFYLKQEETIGEIKKRIYE